VLGVTTVGFSVLGLPRYTRPRMSKRKPSRPALTPRQRAAKRLPSDVLYEISVQEPEPELDFLQQVYRERNGRLPQLIREDFSGSAFNSATWVARRAGNTAIAVDLDKRALLTHSKRHTASLTPEQRTNLRLVHANVLDESLVKAAKSQVILALNFSYWIFRTRVQLLDYCRKARAALQPGGVLIMDFFGGSDALVELEERKRRPGFTYVWEQQRYNPITGDYRCAIHFDFADGTRRRNCFVYPWRLWTIPELRDVLADAGFARTDVYLEKEDRKGNGTGKWARTLSAPADRCFLAYLVSNG